MSEEKISLATYYKRSVVITYFLPTMLLFLSFLFEVCFNVSLNSFALYYSISIFLMLLVVPFIATLGAQCFHDCLFETTVESDSKTKAREFKRKHINSLVAILIVAVTGFIFFIDSNKKQAIDMVTEAGYLEEVNRLELEMSGVTPDTYILERNVENLFDYYDDLHGFHGLRDLAELDREIGMQTPPVFTFTLSEPRKVPVFRVFVTRRGLLNDRFKDAVTRNVLEHSLNHTGSAICVVEFVHHDNYFGLFYLLIKSSLVGVHTGYLERSGYNSSMVLTPENNGYIYWYLSATNEKIPPWAVE